MQATNVFAALAVLATVAVPVSLSNPQRFGGTGPSPLPVGGTLNIQYTNQMKPNTAVTVTVYNNLNPEETVTIEMQTNSAGVATAPFDVPIDWGAAVLTAPDSQDMTIMVAWDV